MITIEAWAVLTVSGEEDGSRLPCILTINPRGEMELDRGLSFLATRAGIASVHFFERSSGEGLIEFQETFPNASVKIGQTFSISRHKDTSK